MWHCRRRWCLGPTGARDLASALDHGSLQQGEPYLAATARPVQVCSVGRPRQPPLALPAATR